MSDWPFRDPPNFNAFSTRQVCERGEPILAVYHDADDGAWQFMGPGEWTVDDLVVICLAHALERDPSVGELADMPRGWGAERAAEGAPWRRFRLPTEDEAAEHREAAG